MDCRRAFGSKKSPQPPEIGGSSVGAAEAARDLLQWPIRKRRRGSHSRPAVAAEPTNSTKAEKTRMQSLDLMDLPLKKRICKEVAPASAESGGGGMIQCFDLNKLPQPGDEQEILALRWYYQDEDGAPGIYS